MPPDDDIVVIGESEEDTLRKIFESGAPVERTRPAATASGLAPQQQRYIELKLGKRVAIQPGEERSLSIALTARLPAGQKYNLSCHFEFLRRYQDRVAMTLELVNGTSVQVDLTNVSEAAVEVEAEQHVVLMEERRPPVKPKVSRPKKRPAIKSGDSSATPGSGEAEKPAVVGGVVNVHARKRSGSSSRGGSVSPEGRISPKQGRLSPGNGGLILTYDVRDGRLPFFVMENTVVFQKAVSVGTGIR